MRIAGKGLLRVGMDADINIFKPEALHERATYLAPKQESEGLDTVFVGGVPILLGGKWTEKYSGKVIKR